MKIGGNKYKRAVPRLKRCCLGLVLAVAVPALGGNPGANPPAPAENGVTGPQQAVETPDDERSTDYFPLTSPKRREYEVEYKVFVFHDRGKLVTTVRTQELDGKEYAAHTTSLTGTRWDRTYTLLYRVSPRGIMVRSAGEEERLFLPQPLTPGLEWTTVVDGVPAKHEVIGKEDVVCGETTYRDCMKVVSSLDNGTTIVRWWAPGVGLVKHTTSSSLASSTTTLTGSQ